MPKQCESINMSGDRCNLNVMLERVKNVPSEPVYQRVWDEKKKEYKNGDYMCHLFPVRPASHGLCYYHKCVADGLITCWQSIIKYEERYGKGFHRI